MKLTHLYSSAPEVFPAIDFHAGLNVVFARVTKPEVMQQDSHNLGKTFLTTVIDYALLGGVEKGHPFKEQAAVFAPFVFYVEVETHYGKFVTVKRPLAGARSIAIHESSESSSNLSSLPENSWSHSGLGLEKAREILDKLTRSESYPTVCLSLRDEEDHKLLFTRADVVRELHDDGDSGRLFRMPPF